MSDLADQLSRGVSALGREAYDEAATLLGGVWTDPAFQQAEDLADIRARVASLYAQALFETGDVHGADKVCRQAIRLVRKLRDKEGLQQVRSLQDRIVGTLAHDAEAAARLAEQQRVASTPLDELVASASTDEERVAVLVRKATAHCDVGELDEGGLLAQRGLDDATVLGHATWQVMARLALARARPSEALEHLVAARQTADEASEFNLISTIARAADVCGVELPGLRLPERGV
jgi:hypothetical protein